MFGKHVLFRGQFLGEKNNELFKQQMNTKNFINSGIILLCTATISTQNILLWIINLQSNPIV